MNQIEQTQNDIETLISEVESFSTLMHIKAKEYNQMYSGLGISNPWDAEIKPYLDGFIAEYRYKKDLYSLKALLKIKENLNFVSNIIMNLNQTFEEKHSLAAGIELLNKSLAESKNHLDYFYEYKIDKILTEIEFQNILADISKKRPDITNTLSEVQYEKLNNSSKRILSRNTINIYNKLNTIETNDDIDDIRSSIDYIETVTEWSTLENKFNELKLTANQMAENFTIKNIDPINNGYEHECVKLTKKIESLNKNIIKLFYILMAIFTSKFFILLCFPSKFNNIYTYLTFISLILSISALIAYFVKDRNRLIKSHDQYKLNVLELSTLPDYMGELDRDQRKKLYIDLSHNFFRGSVPNQENNKNSNNELEGLSKSLAELSKIVSNLKGVIK